MSNGPSIQQSSTPLKPQNTHHINTNIGAHRQTQAQTHHPDLLHIGAWAPDLPRTGETAVADSRMPAIIGRPVSALMAEDRNIGPSAMLQAFVNDFSRDQPWSSTRRS